MIGILHSQPVGCLVHKLLTWFTAKQDGRPEVFLVCQCGVSAPLLATHKISNTGEVQPSVVCDNCNFHEHIRLLGYKGELK